MATYNNIKKIKIGDNVFNLYDSGNSGGTITSVKTTAGAHTTVNVTSGAVSFNVPTKTSHLTNDSGFITTDTNTWRAIQVNGTQVLAGTTGTNALNLKAGTGISLTNSSGTITITNSSTNTDEKVKAIAATASTKYYLVMGGNGGTAETKVYDARLSYTNTTDYSALTIGDASHDGNIQLYDSTSGYKSVLGTAQLTEARTLTLPDKTGTVALTDDLEAISTPVGVIQAYAGSTAPSGWLICDGSAVSRTTYSELFEVIGTTYGSGNGSTTFNLPDLRGRAPIGSGLGTAEDAVERTLGQSGGSERVTLTVEQIPSHNHTLNTWKNGQHYYGATSGNVLQWWSSAYGSTDAAVSSTGGSQSHGNMQPYLVINYIIKA